MLIHCIINFISLNRGGSYIDSPKWPKNNDDKCFQSAITVSLNHEQIQSHPERILNIKPFTDQYNWKEIDFPSHIKDWKKFESNNKSVALAVKKMSALLRGITSKHKGDSYCINCFHSFSTKEKLKKQPKYVKIMIIAI